MEISRLGVLAVLFPVCLAAQATVEHALGSGLGATAAAPAQKVGRGIAATFDKLGSVLQEPDKSKSAQSPPSSAPSAQGKSSVVKLGSNDQAPAPSVSFEDIAGIKEGMEYGEVIRRFGPPALKLTTSPGEETLCYSRKDQNLDVQMRNGKVAAIKKSQPSSPALATLP